MRPAGQVVAERVRQALKANPDGLTMRDLLRRTGAPQFVLVQVLDLMQRGGSVHRERDLSRRRMPYVYTLTLSAKALTG